MGLDKARSRNTSSREFHFPRDGSAISCATCETPSACQFTGLSPIDLLFDNSNRARSLFKSGWNTCRQRPVRDRICAVEVDIFGKSGAAIERAHRQAALEDVSVSAVTH